MVKRASLFHLKLIWFSFYLFYFNLIVLVNADKDPYLELIYFWDIYYEWLFNITLFIEFLNQIGIKYWIQIQLKKIIIIL